MHTITVTGHEPGDYLHPDQRLEVVDEATGHRYEMYLRSNALASRERGEVSLFIPASAVRDIQTDRDYCVVTLSLAVTEREVRERRARLAGLSSGRPPQARRRPAASARLVKASPRGTR